MENEQLNLFKVAASKKTAAYAVEKKYKPAFPELSLLKGLNQLEATADSVFWHRLLLGKSIRNSNIRVFVQLLSNEIDIKNGNKDSYRAIQDSLIKSFTS